MLDAVLRHPFQPGFLLFAEFDLRLASAIQRRDEVKHPFFQPLPCLGRGDPILAVSERRDPRFRRQTHEIRNLGPKTVRHGKGGQFGPADGMDQNRHKAVYYEEVQDGKVAWVSLTDGVGAANDVRRFRTVALLQRWNMNRFSTKLLAVGMALALVGVVAAAAPVPIAAPPTFEAVEAAVESVLHADKKYARGDLLTHKQVAAVLDAVEKIGWKLDDRRGFEKLALDDNSFLVEKLRSKSGQEFYRQVADLPLAIDRLDRLSQLPQGRSTVERLIKGPDGHKLLDYMTNADGGRELAKMLSKDGRGDFNSPTGKIYTEDQLVSKLKERHDAAVAALKKATKRK